MVLRYEDVVQDGRVAPIALSHAVGEIVWREHLARNELLRRLFATGVFPILTRLVIEAGEEPVPVTRPLDGEGVHLFAHDLDDTGEVDRLFLDIWTSVSGLRGRTNLPKGPGDGERVAVGRVFAEHVFTRPWGPIEARKVRRFEVDGAPEVPPARMRFRPLPRAADLPKGARLLDPRPVVDAAPIVFGLAHTDSNQHVNSLVYVRLFEEALLRRLAAHVADGRRATAVLGRWIEIGYRKPCFAGDRVRVRLQAFERDGEVGAIGAFVPEDDPQTNRPYAWVAMGAR